MENGSNAAHNEFHVNLFDVLIDANFTSSNTTASRFFAKGNRGKSNEQPFTIGFHTPDSICFTRDSTYVSNLVRTEDLITFNRSLMDNILYRDAEIKIFIHHPRQLIRSMAIPSFTSSFPNYQHKKLLSFKISQSTVIRKRPDYREPCSKTIHDYDNYFMNMVISKTKCIPPYWKDSTQDISGLTVCTSQEQLQMVYENITDWENVMERNARPCVEMYNIVVWNWQDVEGTKKADDIQIKFYYQEQYYQELEYLPDFDAETFISSIGGFVGIFLGYSIMQFPDMLGKFSYVFK